VWPPLGGSTQTEPIANVELAFGGGGVNASGRTFNGQIGPSNTFTLYAFNSAGAQDRERRPLVLQGVLNAYARYIPTSTTNNPQSSQTPAAFATSNMSIT
jgi:hypothetical protein